MMMIRSFRKTKASDTLSNEVDLKYYIKSPGTALLIVD
jgi:hypothetical protein